MGKKTRDEFMEAFRTLKKPKKSPAVPSKYKSALEKAVGKDDDTSFAANAADIARLDKGYLVDLVSYKLSKHYDNDDKRPFWQEKLPDDVVDAALAKLVPRGLDDPATQALLEKSVAQGKKGVTKLLYDRDPTNALEHLYDRLEDAIARKNDADTRSRAALKAGDRQAQGQADEIILAQKQHERKFSDAIGDLSPDKSFAGLLKFELDHLVAVKNDKSIPRLSKALANRTLLPADIKAAALNDPDYFIGTVLAGIDSGARMRVLSSPDLRDALQAASPDEWSDLAEAMPMLKLFDTVEDNRRGKPKQADPKLERQALTEELFDSLLSGADVKVAYIGTNVGSPSEIVAGLDDDDDDEPPRTDCHNIVNILQYLVGAMPGLGDTAGLDVKQVHWPNALMTKKLSDIPGKGTLDRSFGGNVFNDQSQSLGMILFTGEAGINSHTWLEVDGVPYDPVLGTSGSDVKGAVFKGFDMIDMPAEAKSTRKLGQSGAWYFVSDSKLVPAATPMGFSTGYFLTKNPKQHMTQVEIDALGWADKTF